MWGEGKVLMINEENFYLATRERKPYVVDSGGVKSFYAVCPECDNPIQLIGLLRRQQDSLPHRPYGRHIGHDVPGVAVYDEDAYLSCPFSDPGYWRTDRKRKPSNPTGQALYRIMRDRFDRVEYAWRESSGLLLGIKSLRRALTVWRNDKGWLNYGSTYHNLPQMLFFGLPQETLYGQCVSKDSPLASRLAAADGIFLEPSGFSDSYLRIKTSRFVDVGFVLGARKARVVNDRLAETFLLGVNVEGKPLGSDLVVHTDPVWFSRILNMPDWHENHRLSAMAADVLD